ncbi:hypothetical protein ACFPJ1_36600 [Kribbella qitaiheensis]|uniref:hypothetical protein n=1 Tax=Kribbella qitaiheensis TaxID=1544730 RepID=UPI003619EB7E
MTSGLELLLDARVMSDADVARAFGHGGRSNADEVDRAALVAALLSSFIPADAPLIRELTRQEIAAVGDADSGCGDVLLACCWLLFMIGHVEDAALVWRAKNVNFDAHCYIDSVFLIPQGGAVTAEFARSHDLMDLVDWVEGEWIRDPETVAREWRSGSFFARVPPAAASLEDLARWMRQ